MTGTQIEAPIASPPVGPARVLSVEGVGRLFRGQVALRNVSLAVEPGEIHALLGPNGAGKTTLLRIVAGLVDADEGSVRLAGAPGGPSRRRWRKLLGLVPSGDRTFYLRLSGTENLVFFGRLQGLRRRTAAQRAGECLRAVGLEQAADRMVGTYSHGMQKRLSVARALLTSPRLLAVDEATHDLDPDGVRRVKELVEAQAAAGVAVVWATQRIDEIRGFADQVTLLHRGAVRFAGTVPQLMRHAEADTHVLELRSAGSAEATAGRAQAALDGRGTIRPAGGDPDHYLLALREGVILGEALAGLERAGIGVLACREERSTIESAFLRLTER